MRKYLFCLALICASLMSAFAQMPKQDKGSFYAYWGWNRGWYTKSDIRIYGSDHDFTLYDVQAKDLQSDFRFKTYFFVNRLTIPQTNVKAGYFLTDRYSVAFGFDHMKYKVVQNQSVIMDGYIDRVFSHYNGEYSNEEIRIAEDFLRYNHTDGLNYVFGECNRHDQWWQSPGGKMKLRTEAGLGVALLRPRTDVAFLNYQGPNVYHNAGYGVHGKLGINLVLWKHFSVLSEVKAGFINMQNIRAEFDASSGAQQRFGFLQANIHLGATFGFVK